MKEHILVIGGAGYIGSRMVRHLQRAGYAPIVVDNLSRGRREWVRAPLLVADAEDAQALNTLFEACSITAVMLFAGPHEHDRASGMLHLLEMMARHDVRYCVYSSRATAFGGPQCVSTDESRPSASTCPHDRAKWAVERILKYFDITHGLRSACLRYFNTAGANRNRASGELYAIGTHISSFSSQPEIAAYGTDYSSSNNSPIQNYLDVDDLCEAHLLALEALLSGSPEELHKLGNGNDYQAAGGELPRLLLA